MRTSRRAELAALLEWQTWSVFRRNAKVYLRNWRTALFPPAMEPLIFFLAFGMGLGAYVGLMTYGDRPVAYADYVAPGLLAYTAFSTPFFECLYASYVRMFYQKTWNGMLATQVEMQHIVWGEITWAGFRGMLNASIVAVVLGVLQLFGVVELRWWVLPLLPPLAFVTGWTFGAFALVFTAIVPSIDHMNYPVFLVGVPLGLVSNTYFPVRSDNPVLQVLIELNPVYHLAETYRELLLLGEVGRHLPLLIATAGTLLVLLALLDHRLLRRRVLGP